MDVKDTAHKMVNTETKKVKSNIFFYWQSKIKTNLAAMTPMMYPLTPNSKPLIQTPKFVLV